MARKITLAEVKKRLTAFARKFKDASLYGFGMVTCRMHMAWTAAVCGRLKSDYRYSNTIVYNNYPFPTSVSQQHVDAIAAAAQLIIDERIAEEKRCEALNSKASLAAMYAPGAMPSGLLAAHKALDKVVDKAFGYKGADDDASRVAFLFKLYEQATSLLQPVSAHKGGR